MIVWIQQGVIGQLIPPLHKALARLELLYREYRSDLYITSLQECFHGTSSLHYDRRAVDMKRQFVPLSRIKALCSEEEGFFITEHELPADIFHIEYRGE